MTQVDMRRGLTTEPQIEEMRRQLERAGTPAQKRKARGLKLIETFSASSFWLFS
jgi:urease gamma subunit